MPLIVVAIHYYTVHLKSMELNRFILANILAIVIVMWIFLHVHCMGTFLFPVLKTNWPDMFIWKCNIQTLSVRVFKKLIVIWSCLLFLKNGPIYKEELNTEGSEFGSKWRRLKGTGNCCCQMELPTNTVTGKSRLVLFWKCLPSCILSLFWLCLS